MSPPPPFWGTKSQPDITSSGWRLITLVANEAGLTGLGAWWDKETDTCPPDLVSHYSAVPDLRMPLANCSSGVLWHDRPASSILAQPVNTATDSRHLK